MKKLYKIALAAVLIFFILALLGNSNKTSTPPPSPAYTNTSINATKGTYDIGIGFFDMGVNLSERAMEKIGEAANVAFIQRQWKKEANPYGNDYYTAVGREAVNARATGLKVYLAFEVLSGDRKSLILENGSVGSFADQKVQEDYIDLVRRVTRDYKPDYFIISVEANLQARQTPSEYEAYKSLFPRAYEAAKAASPQTKVGVSHAYMDYTYGNDCFDSSDLETYRGYVADFQQQDFLGLSVYPFCYLSPDKMPIDFIYNVANLSSKPLFISETGWTSENMFFPPSINLPSSPQMQADYIVRLSQMVEYAHERGKQIDAVNYISLIDPSDYICGLITAGNAAMQWVCSLALLDSDWNEKPAFLKMKEWKSQIA